MTMDTDTVESADDADATPDAPDEDPSPDPTTDVVTLPHHRLLAMIAFRLFALIAGYYWFTRTLGEFVWTVTGGYEQWGITLKPGLFVFIFGGLLIEGALIAALWIYSWPLAGIALRHGWRARDRSIGQPVADEPDAPATEAAPAVDVSDLTPGTDVRPTWSGRSDAMAFESWLALALVVCGLWILVESIPNIVTFLWNLQDNELTEFYWSLGQDRNGPVILHLITKTLKLAVGVTLLMYPRQVVRLWRRLPGNRPGQKPVSDEAAEPAEPAGD